MPITSSAIKKARQDTVHRERNRILRDAYKNAVKEVKKHTSAGETKKASESLKKAYSAIDKAAKKNIIHKNNAARRKARIAALLKNNKPKKAEPKAETKKSEKK